MKKVLWLFLFLAIKLTVNAQDVFEGKVVYRVTPLNPNNELISDEKWQEAIKQKLGGKTHTIQTYFYKECSYMTIIEGVDIVNQLYDSKSQRIYNWIEGSDNATYFDVTKFYDEVLNVSKLDSTEIIMGVKCQVIEIETNLSTMYIFYNSNKYIVDKGCFSNHLYGNWNRITDEIGVLPLKIITVSGFTRIEQLMIESKEMEVAISRLGVPEFENLVEQSSD